MIKVEDAVEVIKAIGLDGLELKVVDGNVVVVIPEGLNEYARLKNLKSLHDKTDKTIIKKNIKKYANENNLTAEKLASLLDVKKNTAQSFTTISNPSKPSLINMMMFASFLSLDQAVFYVDEEGSEEKNSPLPHTKSEKIIPQEKAPESRPEQLEETNEQTADRSQEGYTEQPAEQPAASQQEPQRRVPSPYENPNRY